MDHKARTAGASGGRCKFTRPTGRFAATGHRPCWLSQLVAGQSLEPFASLHMANSLFFYLYFFVWDCQMAWRNFFIVFYTISGTP